MHAEARWTLGQAAEAGFICVRCSCHRHWVAVYCGKADNISRTFQGFLHPDGSFGPIHEPYIYRTMVDLQRRGFCIQIR